MEWIDTHAHLYDEQFDDDISLVIERAIEKGVTRMLMPNCDTATIAPMISLCYKYPSHCHFMIGLHPCYIKNDYESELSHIKSFINNEHLIAIGEIGLDYYWDKTYVTEQKKAFEIQINWAKDLKKPIVIHTRDSIDDSITIIENHQDGNLKGVFHCFSGDEAQAKRIIDLGFYLGIGGVLTFKNSSVKNVIKNIPIENIILETDAPYLAPVPYRGKRNESSYIPLIGESIADIYEMKIEEVALLTTKNAEKLFFQ